MSLPEFLFIPSQSFLQGNGFILQTTAPFAVGKLYLCDNEEDIELMESKVGNKPLEKMEGYSIFITHFSNLIESKISSDNVLKDMLNYYLSEKITPKLGKFKKYKE